MNGSMTTIAEKVAAMAARIEALEREVADANADAERLAMAAKGLGAMPEGYCFCSANRIGDDSKTHEPECADLRAALKGYENDRV